MHRILCFLIAFSVLGFTLAQPFNALPMRPGMIGALLMVAIALWLRQRWNEDSAAPEAPEREALLTLAGTLVALSHLVASLWQIGPAMQLHSVAAHAMAIDNWTLFGAALLMAWIARAPGPRHDERDLLISAAALKAGHVSLLMQLLALVLWLGFGRDAVLEQLSRAMLAQLLVCFWIFSYVVQTVARLVAYARDRRLAAELT